MMAPERHVDEGATTVPAMIVVDAVPQPGTEHSEGRAPLRWPYSSREQQERALQAVAEAEMSESSSESSEDSERAENKSDAGRDNDEEVNSESGESSKSSTCSAQAAQPPDELDFLQAPSNAQADITQEEIAVQFAKMFDPTASEPAVSGLTKQSRSVNNKLVKLAWDYVNSLDKSRIDALSKAFGNFDRVVAVGWLVCDIVRVGMPLAERGQAHTLGLKIKYEAGKVVKHELKLKRDGQREASRLAATDPKRFEVMQQAEVAIEKFMSNPVELPLPADDAGLRRDMPTTRVRKRKRKAVSAEQPFEQRIAVAEEEVIQAEKAAKRAKAEAERVEKLATDKEKVVVRIFNRLDASATKNRKTFLALADKALSNRMEATIDAREAENEFLSAQLEVKEAEHAVLRLEWEYALQREGSALSDAHEARETARAYLDHAKAPASV
jgi:hypothetical protein